MLPGGGGGGGGGDVVVDPLNRHASLAIRAKT